MEVVTNEQVLETYAQLKTQAQDLDKRIKDLAQTVVTIIENMSPEDKKVENSFGKFTVESRRTWVYSPAVTMHEGKIKELKHEEEENGTAQEKISEFPKFVAPKE